jgi:hypothetical protein
MKKSICLLIILFAGRAYSQIRVDDIASDVDAIKFIQQIGKQNRIKWTEINFNEQGSIILKYSKHQAEFVDSIAKQRWVIADFNSDGRKDLVASFSSRKNYDIYAFVSLDDTAYNLVYLGNEYSEFFPTGVYLIKNEGEMLVNLKIHQPGSTGDDVRNLYRSDTLVCKHSSFVEWKSNYENFIEFDSIVFKISQVWNMGRSIPVTKLYKDGTIKLYQDFFIDTMFQQKWKNGIKTCVLGEGHVRKIGEVLAIVDYLKLKSNYDVPSVSDLTSYTTEVYIGGLKKVVFDYGGLNTYGLRLFYREMSRLKLLCKGE